MSEADAAWLEALRPWAVQLAGTAGLTAEDAEDAVQDAFASAAAAWGQFVSPDELPGRTARRRWLYVILLRGIWRIGRAESRSRGVDGVDLEQVDRRTSSESPELTVMTRDLLRHLLTSTTPERWRAWVLSKVDGVPVAEIARQEGYTVATGYSRIRLAEQDFAAAFAREAAALKGPGRGRPFTKRRK